MKLGINPKEMGETLMLQKRRVRQMRSWHLGDQTIASIANAISGDSLGVSLLSSLV